MMKTSGGRHGPDDNGFPGHDGGMEFILCVVGSHGITGNKTTLFKFSISHSGHL